MLHQNISFELSKVFIIYTHLVVQCLRRSELNKTLKRTNSNFIIRFY